MKRTLAILLTVIVLLSTSSPAYAAEVQTNSSTYTVTVNEYDVYVAIRTATPQQLSKMGISARSAEQVKSYTIEEELLKLSKLTSDELKSLGYTNEQIALLHNYSGERIENTPEIRGVFADMTATFTAVRANASAFTVQVDWVWSNMPVFSGSAIQDLIAIRWQGTNTNGAPLNVAYNAAGSYCSVKYYTRSGTYQYSTTTPIECTSPYDHAYAYITMGTDVGDGTGWVYYAKSGTLRLKVERTGTDSIQEVAFVFAYGHTTIVISPSLSLPLSFGIGFNVGTEKMIEKAIRMNSSCTITEY